MEVRPDPGSTTTTSEQRAAAIEWLDRTGPYAHWAPFTHDSAAARDAIKAMLAEPRMPEEPSEQIIEAVWDAWQRRKLPDPSSRTIIELMYHACRAELLKDHGREDMAAGGKSHATYTSSPNCTPAAREPAPPAQASDPVLPAHPTPGLLKAMADAFRKSEEDKLEDDMRLVHEAAHAHLSFKRTKTVYVVAAHWDGFKPSQWRDCSTTEEAGRHAAAFAKDGGLVTITPEQRP